MLGKITADGVFLEALERDPGRFLPDVTETDTTTEVISVNLNQPMDDIRKQLSQYPIRTRCSITSSTLFCFRFSAICAPLIHI